MSDAWGQLTWSIGNFGAQNDSTVDVTGASLSLGFNGFPEVTTTVDFGWGRAAWNELSWNVNFQNAFGDPNGLSLSATLDSVTTKADGNVIPTSSLLTLTLGEENAFTDIDVTLNSLSLSTFLNSVDADPDANLTGISMTMTTGSVVVEDDINTGWGRNNGWSTFAWNIAGTLLLEGVSATVDLGDVTEITGDGFVTLEGIEITATLNDIVAVGLAEVPVNGLGTTITTGQLDIEPDANPVGIEMSANLGTVAAYNLEGWGRFFWGEFVWGATGLWATGDLTGVQLTATIDNIGEITGDGNIDVTGQEATIAEGNLDADTDANITGIELTIATGDLTDIIADANVTPDSIALSIALGNVEATPNTIASPIGLSLTMALDSVDNTGNANISVTGIALTASVGTVFPLIWNEVQTDSDATWTEVDTAA